jgi:hypothetical protein
MQHLSRLQHIGQNNFIVNNIRIINQYCAFGTILELAINKDLMQPAIIHNRSNRK